MTTMTIDAHELEGLGESFTRGAGRIGAAVSAVLRKSAYDIQRDAQSAAPVDTGFLKNSISTTFTGDGRFMGMAAEIGPTAEYGIYQELGTSVMPAQPYLAPAFDRRYPEFERRMGQIGITVLR